MGRWLANKYNKDNDRERNKETGLQSCNHLVPSLTITISIIGDPRERWQVVILEHVPI